MGTWTNDDGLPIEFGTDKSSAAKGGFAPSFGNRQKLVVDITLSELADASSTVGFVDEYELPEGAIIHSANITVITAAVGIGALLDIGVIDASADSSGTSDDDGFDAAVATGDMGTPGTVVVGNGALVGTVLDAHYKVAASYDTAAFSAGVVRLEIEFEPTLNRESQ